MVAISENLTTKDSVAKELVSMKEVMTRLSEFQNSIDGRNFQRLYVENGGTVRIAKHLWEKFVQYNYNIIRLFQVCDLANQRILPKMVEQWIAERKDGINHKWVSENIRQNEEAIEITKELNREHQEVVSKKEETLQHFHNRAEQLGDVSISVEDGTAIAKVVGL